ncbi:unnamed protein product, partial [Porites evermanni]
DHKPLESILRKSLLSATGHFQRMMLRLQNFDLESPATVQQPIEAHSGLAVLKAMIKAGWPDTQEEVPECIREYFSFRDELSGQDGLVLEGERLMILPSMRGVQAEIASEPSGDKEMHQKRQRSC